MKSADTLKGLPVPVVFDHMGHLPEPAGPDHPGFKVIADLIDKHGARVKLTRAYRGRRAAGDRPVHVSASYEFGRGLRTPARP